MGKLRKGRQDAVERVWLALPAADLGKFTEVGAQVARLLSDYARSQDGK